MKLDEIRKKIDLIDEKILVDLAERFTLVKEMKRLKDKLGLPVEDKQREKKLKRKIAKKGKKLALRDLFIVRLFDLIIQESKEIQDSMIH